MKNSAKQNLYSALKTQSEKAMKTPMFTRLKKAVSRILENTFHSVPNEIVMEGMNWYRKANRQIRESAMNLDVTPDLFAKVVAILSPASRWEYNIAEAYKLIFTLKYERSQLEKLSFTTYKHNVEKAIDVYDEKVDFVMTDTNMKTYSFYRNLMMDPEYVTIDRWMIRLLDFNKYFGKSLTSKRYKQYAENFFEVAKKLGLKPYELQAILWEYIRTKE